VDLHTLAALARVLVPGRREGAGAEPDARQPLRLQGRRERAVVLSRIQALMAYWDIQIADLQDTSLPPQATPVAPKPVKYRHPVTGDTWDGQGPHPDWLRRALLQEGLRVDELRPSAD
jgi:DNA-binding protein H-NS